MTVQAYEEIVDVIAAGSSPQSVITFRPSKEARQCVWDLVAREKAGDLSQKETSELEHYLQLEHIMRLAKARAQRWVWADWAFPITQIFIWRSALRRSRSSNW